MTIEFSCPQCAQQIRTPDATAGKRGKCPSCAAIVRIPGDPSAAPPAKPAPPPKAIPAAKPPVPQSVAEAPPTGPIEFFCSLCGQLVRTPQSAAGKKGKCPHCQGVMQIPLKSRAAKSSAQPTSQAATAPRRSPTPPAKAVEDLGLAPLDDLPPLTETKPQPKPAARPAAKMKPAPKVDEDDDRELRLQSNVPLAPLTPLDSNSSGNAMVGLAPLNNDLFGGSDPLAAANAGLAGGDLFGGAPLGGDPFGGSSSFGSPASVSLAPAAYSSPSVAPAGPQKPDSVYVLLPAIFQLLAVIPFFLWNGFVFASTVFVLIVAMLAPTGSPEAAATGSGLLALLLVLQVLGLGVQIWIIFGSIQMMMLKGYDNATAAAWMSCVPCFGLCGIPFGIWSLIVLQTPQYKRMFRD